MGRISESNFSMRSSRAAAAETNSEKTQEREWRRTQAIVLSQSAVHARRALVRRSARGCVKLTLGRFAFGGSGQFEELARLKAEHIGKDVGRELLILVLRSRTTALCSGGRSAPCPRFGERKLWSDVKLSIARSCG